MELKYEANTDANCITLIGLVVWRRANTRYSEKHLPESVECRRYLRQEAKNMTIAVTNGKRRSP